MEQTGEKFKLNTKYGQELRHVHAEVANEIPIYLLDAASYAKEVSQLCHQFPSKMHL